MVSKSLDGNILTLVVAEDLLSSNAEAAAREFENIIGSASGYGALKVDLTACKMIDSVGLNLIFSLLCHCKEKGVSGSVIISKGHLERIMQVAQLGKLFKIEVR